MAIGGLAKPLFCAHTPSEEAGGKWDDLVGHLRRTADRARAFASPFGGGDLAYLVGLWHDLGKFNPLFQDYLAAQHEGRAAARVPHAIWGAAFAYRAKSAFDAGSEVWKEIALPIAGHHAGLHHPDLLASAIHQFSETSPDALPLLARHVSSMHAAVSLPPPRSNPTRREFFIRMVFSALVDADYLDTESHFHPGRAATRSTWPTVTQLWDRFQSTYVNRFQSSGRSKVNDVRQAVYAACIKAAESGEGVYRLTVPTGGGKTLSGLGFALKHAHLTGRRRVVVAIPYTSIIEQTAQEYRAMLGSDAVLEHHSQYAPPDDQERQDYGDIEHRLAAENWDAPVVVTTTVQLFESLLSNKPGAVRKLHNLANSVLVIDEAQCLPPNLFEPTLDVLRALVEEYGVTLVLCTATQPALAESPYVRAFRGLDIREIVPDYHRHFDLLKRVRYERRPESVSWNEVAEVVRSTRSIMVVLNTRRHALELLTALGGTDAPFHLSTLLCGAHRRELLEKIRQRLEQDGPARLITTQVVEAGVDIDFPVVWRALGPLDRMIQAAGRCNRNMKLPHGGQVVLFEPTSTGMPRGLYRRGFNEAKALLDQHDPNELHSPEISHEYFLKLYSGLHPEGDPIQAKRHVLNFPEVAQDYRLIPDDTAPVVVPFGDSAARLAAWQREPSRERWREMQPFIVNVLSRDIDRLRRDGWIHQLSDRLYSAVSGSYDRVTGLSGASQDPADLVV